MTTATVTSKGQITIPAAVRDALGVEAGDRIEFVEAAAGRYEVVAATASVSAMRGMFGRPRKSVSIEEMNAGHRAARRGREGFGRVGWPDDRVGYQRPGALHHAGRCGPVGAAARLVESLTAEAPGFVPVVAVVELDWVLSSAYGLDREQLAAAFEALLRSKEIVVERAETVWKALRLFTGAKADFADCLIASAAPGAGCERTMTFDRGAVKGCGMVLVG